MTGIRDRLALRQLPLILEGPPPPGLTDFLPGPNAEALAAVRALIAGGAAGGISGGAAGIYLWGGPGTGKTHLARAFAGAVSGAGYVDAGARAGDGLAPLALADGPLVPLAVDGLDALAGQAHAEEALFHRYNRLRDAGLPLLVTAREPPRALPIRLPDLASRLAALLVFRLRELTDADKIRVLVAFGARRGFAVPEEVGRYLLAHRPRGLGGLTAVLQDLDRLTLITQRKLTLPLLRELAPLWQTADTGEGHPSTEADDPGQGAAPPAEGDDPAPG
jgi:DnaA family protein